MRHDWIFEVLRDLKAYAQANGLPALAQKADEAMRVARAELAIATLTEIPPEAEAGAPPVPRRPH